MSDEAGDGKGEEGEEGEEKEEEEDTGLPEDGRPRGLVPNFEIDDTAEPNGSVVALGGDVKVYVTGPAESVAGILLVGDFFGWNGGRVRAVADYLASSLCAVCVVPRLLDTPNWEGGTDGDGLPDDFETGEDLDQLRPWLLKYVWNIFEPKIEAAAVHLRNQGVKRIGGVGFCFGSWAVCKASEIVKELICSVHLYPSVHFMENITDGDCVRLGSRLRSPALFMPGRMGQKTYGPESDMFQAVQQNHRKQAESIPFGDMAHDWVLRGDERRPAVRDAIVTSLHHTAKYLRKFLWPLPVGANDATLRLMCQDGDADMVIRLLDAGVPADGKDVRDIVGLEPLHYAAKSEGNVQPIKILVDYAADVNVAGGIGNETPLHIAASLGSQKAVKSLLQARAATEQIDKGGQTALHYAAAIGSVPVAKMLLDAKANMYAKDDPPAQTPLHLAAWYGREQMVKFFLQMKMDVDPEDLRSQTPQKRALQQGFDAIANILEAERARRGDEAFDAGV